MKIHNNSKFMQEASWRVFIRFHSVIREYDDNWRMYEVKWKDIEVMHI